MCKSLVALLCASCLAVQVWGQGSSGQQAPAPAAAETPAAAGPAAQTASTPSSQFPLDDIKEFSAIMIGSLLPGDNERESHIYRSGDLLRTENWEEKGYMITDLAKLQTHGVTRKGCAEFKGPFLRAYPFSENRPGRKIARTLVGEETVDGHVCKVEDLTITGGDLRVNVMKMRLWQAEDLQGFPIRVEARGTPTHKAVRYKKVVLGPQDPTLFIYPTSCQSLDAIGKAPSSSSKTKKPATGTKQ